MKKETKDKKGVTSLPDTNTSTVREKPHVNIIKDADKELKSGDKIMDLATKGEQPFANLVREQLVLQPATRPISEQYPNGGRKELLFSVFQEASPHEFLDPTATIGTHSYKLLTDS